jgi:hypothetical protein
MKPFAKHKPQEFELWGQDAGALFAKADSEVQSAFLFGLSEEVYRWNSSMVWDTQCIRIADEIVTESTKGVAIRIALMLETLTERLREADAKAAN